jgi:UDP-N-acetyl-D-mannosaminuronic acid dehydrogenase
MVTAKPHTALFRRSCVTSPFKKVCVIGLGYIGLPMAASLASRGIDVLGVDVANETVALINRGETHIEEPELDIIVRAAVTTGKLKAASEPGAADAFILAVPTPFKGEHQPDLSYLEASADSIAPVLKKGDLVVIESTSPVGSTEMISQRLGNLRTDLTFPHSAGEDADIQVAHSPERVLPGRILVELVQNDRVIGGISKNCAERAATLYRMFVSGECHLTSARTAELVKLAENSYRDVNIAFANELSMVCKRLGIDVWDVIELANRHPRVAILQPGPGVGGHCIAVDPWFIVDSAPEEARLIRTAREVNDAKPESIIAEVIAATKSIENPVVASLGLTYKADVDDTRESPAVEIVAALGARLKSEILVVDPHLSALPEQLAALPSLRITNLDEALTAAQIVVLLVDHREFRGIDRSRLSDKVIVDTRGLWR